MGSRATDPTKDPRALTTACHCGMHEGTGPPAMQPSTISNTRGTGALMLPSMINSTVIEIPWRGRRQASQQAELTIARIE